MDVWLLLLLCVASPSFFFPCSGVTFVLKALSDRFLPFSGPFVLILSMWSQAMIPPVDDSLSTCSVFILVRIDSVLLCWVFRRFTAYVIGLPPVWNLLLVWRRRTSWRFPSSTCSKVRCQSLSFESLHVSVCTVHVLFMLFHSTSFRLWERLVDIMLIGVLRKRFLSRHKSLVH